MARRRFSTAVFFRQIIICCGRFDFYCCLFFRTQDGGADGKGERFVLGPRPKLVVGAGGAPGYGFQLVYFDVRRGREKKLALGCSSQVDILPSVPLLARTPTFCPLFLSVPASRAD